jgi:microtubule-associated protein-like 1/2
MCAGFHPSGSVVAVGLQTGRWLVFDSVTGTYVASGSDTSEQLSSVKYSPDGSKMSVASHDNYIYIYTVENDGTAYEKKGRCSGHSSFVTHIDWSSDSQSLQSVSGDYELLYWDTETCKQIASAPYMKDTKWSSWNCILGFPLAGIWSEGADGTDINAVDRDGAQNLVATADDFGRVNLFSWPCFHAKSECNTGRGHSSHVTCVRFLSDDLTLMSTGGKDTAIMQWGIV